MYYLPIIKKHICMRIILPSVNRIAQPRVNVFASVQLFLKCRDSRMRSSECLRLRCYNDFARTSRYSPGFEVQPVEDGIVQRSAGFQRTEVGLDKGPQVL